MLIRHRVFFALGGRPRRWRHYAPTPTTRALAFRAAPAHPRRPVREAAALRRSCLSQKAPFFISSFPLLERGSEGGEGEKNLLFDLWKTF